MRIGFIGLGNMGRPMAANLARAGQDLIVYDIERSVVDGFVEEFDARPANGLASLAQNADIIITIVPTGRDVRRIALGEDGSDGLVAGLSDGKILLDMSSSDPTGTVTLAGELAKHGVAMVDAPVSGGVKRAVDGSLAIMAGGAAADVERCRPLLDIMGGQIFECGPVGAGHAMKALNNYVSAAGLLAVCEALIVAERFGLDPRTLNEVLKASTGRNNTTDRKVEPFILSRSFDSGFALALLRKDVGLAQDLAESLSLDAPWLKGCESLLEEAAQTLGADADHTEAFVFLKRRLGADEQS